LACPSGQISPICNAVSEMKKATDGSPFQRNNAFYLQIPTSCPAENKHFADAQEAFCLQDSPATSAEGGLVAGAILAAGAVFAAGAGASGLARAAGVDGTGMVVSAGGLGATGTGGSAGAGTGGASTARACGAGVGGAGGGAGKAVAVE
jgi:hypothetical protein